MLLISSFRLAEALKRNKTLIQADQREYQKDLENKFTKFTESLQPLSSACKQSTIIETTLSNNKRYNNLYSSEFQQKNCIIKIIFRNKLQFQLVTLGP